MEIQLVSIPIFTSFLASTPEGQQRLPTVDENRQDLVYKIVETTHICSVSRVGTIITLLMSPTGGPEPKPDT